MHVSKRLEDVLKECDSRIHEALRYGNGNPKKGDYLDLSSKEGEISYLPANRKPDGDPYKCVSLRVSGKPIKILKQFIDEENDPWDTLESIDTSFNNFTPGKFMSRWEREHKNRHMTDRDWEIFLYTFDSYAKTPELEFVVGEDIRKYYHENSYNRDMKLPELQNSCMKHQRCQPYFDVYVHTPACKMLIEKDSQGKLIGRALVWRTDTGETFMDRVYGNERTIKVFHKYAREQGWWHLQYNTYMHPRALVSPRGEKVQKVFKVTIPKLFNSYPYMDTMKNLYVRSEGNTEVVYLTNDTSVMHNSTAYHERVLSGTHG